MASEASTVGAARRALTGATAWPGSDGAPVFDEPWEGRSFGVALSLLDRLGLSWDDFRDALVGAIDADPSRPYYESWVMALERLVTERTAIDADDLARLRRRAASYRYIEAGSRDVEVFPIATDEGVLHAFLADLLTGWWELIRVGPLDGVPAPGRRLPRCPRLSLSDGDLTVDAGGDPLLLCIGPQRGSPAPPLPTDPAPRRRCRHAELYRTWVDGAPSSWGFRMFDGGDHEQLTVSLPSPFLDVDGSPVSEPDWTRLACWDGLRARHLGLAADPADRSGPRPHHG